MPYLIENAAILRENKITRESIMTEGDTIDTIRPDLTRYTFRKMNVEGFLMTPCFTVLDGTLLDNSPSQSTQIVKDYVMNGATTVITYVKPAYERELAGRLENAQKQLSDSPADYAIAVKIPLTSLTPTLIRDCKRRKLPAIFVEINHLSDFAKVPWGWVREAVFPGNFPLIPIFNGTETDVDRQLLVKWTKTMASEKIQTIPHEIKESIPLSPYEMNRLGIYPNRSSLLHKAELSYNLYRNDEEVKNVDEVSMFLYHRERLAVTVLRGCVIRPDEKAGVGMVTGENIKIKTHSYYSF
ncbi:hypothetical protein A8F94_03385 [Bacillus sp. FJAT-27225]|uniref:hypothetical protein n=1 Tax=Bacillus sp. FJAT-27225 TaxID=1743144 RepID=UPI00080C2F4D|nr:hypothetical protein [Bacillus sp. FJAT-27225]OCA90924.1 hypothetical protein A8F94_03385 [Bacillus sp. FJAT-27225]